MRLEAIIAKFIAVAWALIGAVLFLKKRSVSCSFCGKEQSEVELLIDGPGAAVCGECVHSFNKRLQDSIQVEATEKYKDCSFCSFCSSLKAIPFFPNKEHSKKGTKLIRGSKSCICDDCLELCNEILKEKGVKS